MQQLEPAIVTPSYPGEDLNEGEQWLSVEDGHNHMSEYITTDYSGDDQQLRFVRAYTYEEDTPAWRRMEEWENDRYFSTCRYNGRHGWLQSESPGAEERRTLRDLEGLMDARTGHPFGYEDDDEGSTDGEEDNAGMETRSRKRRRELTEAGF